MFPIAALLGMGLPVLSDLVGRALGQIDNPVAQTAANALSQVGSSIAAGNITPEQVGEANRHLEAMTKLDNERELGMAEQINQTMRAEAASEDAWTRRWRPFFGYIVATSWGIQSAAVAWVMLKMPAQAPEIIKALSDNATMWWMALGVLGIAVVKRSEDKALAAGQTPPPGLIDRLLPR